MSLFRVYFQQATIDFLSVQLVGALSCFLLVNLMSNNLPTWSLLPISTRSVPLSASSFVRVIPTRNPSSNNNNNQNSDLSRSDRQFPTTPSALHGRINNPLRPMETKTSPVADKMANNGLFNPVGIRPQQNDLYYQSLFVEDSSQL